MKETAVQRLSGRRRKVVVKKEEVMYIPLLETLQALLKNESVLKEVCKNALVYNNGYLSLVHVGR